MVQGEKNTKNTWIIVKLSITLMVSNGWLLFLFFFTSPNLNWFLRFFFSIRVCIWSLFSTMWEHSQWIPKPKLHGNTWEHLSSTLSLGPLTKFFRVYRFILSHNTFDILHSLASRHDMFSACDSRNLELLQKEFPL